MINFLRSPYAILCVLVLALAAQVPHAAMVFLAMGADVHWYSYVFAIGFAVALEFAVLVFVVHGCTVEGYAFAVASVAMNLCYYSLHSRTLFDAGAFPAWLVSIALPSAIARYSHLAAQSFGVATVHSDGLAQGLQWLRRKMQWPISTATPGQGVEVVAQPVAIDAQEDATPAQADAHVDPRERALQLKSEGLSNAAIARELQVNVSTVGRWLPKKSEPLHP